MARFVSVLGKMIPAKEEAHMENTFGRTIHSEFIVNSRGEHKAEPGEKFIYRGPDREAVKKLKEEGVEYLGRNFKNHPEFLQAVRNMGFNNPKEYLKAIGFDEEKAKKKQEDLADLVYAYAEPERKKEAYMLAGGKDLSGTPGNDLIGGFGTERPRKPEEAKADK